MSSRYLRPASCLSTPTTSTTSASTGGHQHQHHHVYPSQFHCRPMSRQPPPPLPSSPLGPRHSLSNQSAFTAAVRRPPSHSSHAKSTPRRSAAARNRPGSESILSVRQRKQRGSLSIVQTNPTKKRCVGERDDQEEEEEEAELDYHRPLPASRLPPSSSPSSHRSSAVRIGLSALFARRLAPADSRTPARRRQTNPLVGAAAPCRERAHEPSSSSKRSSSATNSSLTLLDSVLLSSSSPSKPSPKTAPPPDHPYPSLSHHPELVSPSTQRSTFKIKRGSLLNRLIDTRRCDDRPYRSEPLTTHTSDDVFRAIQDVHRQPSPPHHHTISSSPHAPPAPPPPPQSLRTLQLSTFSSSPPASPARCAPRQAIPPRKRIKMQAAPDGSATLVLADDNLDVQPALIDEVQLAPSDHPPSEPSLAIRPQPWSAAMAGNRSEMVPAQVGQMGRIAIKEEALIDSLGLKAAQRAISRAIGQRSARKSETSCNRPTEQPPRDHLSLAKIGKWLSRLDDDLEREDGLDFIPSIQAHQHRLPSSDSISAAAQGALDSSCPSSDSPITLHTDTWSSGIQLDLSSGISGHCHLESQLLHDHHSVMTLRRDVLSQFGALNPLLLTHPDTLQTNMMIGTSDQISTLDAINGTMFPNFLESTTRALDQYNLGNQSQIPTDWAMFSDPSTRACTPPLQQSDQTLIDPTAVFAGKTKGAMGMYPGSEDLGQPIFKIGCNPNQPLLALAPSPMIINRLSPDLDLQHQSIQIDVEGAGQSLTLKTSTDSNERIPLDARKSSQVSAHPSVASHLRSSHSKQVTQTDYSPRSPVRARVVSGSEGTGGSGGFQSHLIFSLNEHRTSPTRNSVYRRQDENEWPGQGKKRNRKAGEEAEEQEEQEEIRDVDDEDCLGGFLGLNEFLNSQQQHSMGRQWIANCSPVMMNYPIKNMVTMGTCSPRLKQRSISMTKTPRV